MKICENLSNAYPDKKWENCKELNIVTEDFLHSFGYLPFANEVKTEVSMESKTFIDADRNQKIMAKICKNGSVAKSVFVMPDIVNVRIGGNKTNKVVFVDFADRTTEKAVLSKNDTFSLEQGISICITKKLISVQCGLLTLGGEGSIYNKIIKRALNIFNTKEKEKIDKIENEKKEKKKFEKIKAKKEAIKIKREEAERERQIEIQKEAYLRAMREFNSMETEIGECNNNTETEQENN